MIHLALYIVSTVIVAIAALFTLSLGMASLVGIANLFITPKPYPADYSKRIEVDTIVHRKLDPKTVGWMIVIGSAIVLICIAK